MERKILVLVLARLEAEGEKFLLWKRVSVRERAEGPKLKNLRIWVEMMGSCKVYIVGDAPVQVATCVFPHIDQPFPDTATPKENYINEKRKSSVTIL